jgi:hypothetical protein
MENLLIAFIWILNFAISWWNAYACGKVWAETKSAGGWPRFMTWMGAIMSASGFTWCFLIPMVLGANHFEWLNADATRVAFELGYIMIVPGILFSGLMITIDSWARAYRDGGVLNYGVAAYNTYAQIHNTMSAIETFGGAFKDVGSFMGKAFSGDSEDSAKGAAAFLAILLVVLAAAMGIILTFVIIRKSAAGEILLTREEMQNRLGRKAAIR